MKIKEFIKYYFYKTYITKYMCYMNNIKKIFFILEHNLGADEVLISYEQYTSILTVQISQDMNRMSFFRLVKYLIYCVGSIKKKSDIDKINYRIKFNISDEGDVNTFSMDSTNEQKLIPDEYSMNEKYQRSNSIKLMSMNQFKEKYIYKESQMFWRGSTTGIQIKNIEDLLENRRIQNCLTFKEKKGFNVKISKVSQSELPKKFVLKWLKENKIYSKRVKEKEFANYRYFPDITGNVLAWGTIRKYKIGSLIFKPDNNRRLYYYKFINKWEHYIPIKNDLSDLEEKYIWAKTNESKAINIAYNGYLVANQYIDNIQNYFSDCLKAY